MSIQSNDADYEATNMYSLSIEDILMNDPLNICQIYKIKVHNFKISTMLMIIELIQDGKISCEILISYINGANQPITLDILNIFIDSGYLKMDKLKKILRYHSIENNSLIHLLDLGMKPRAYGCLDNIESYTILYDYGWLDLLNSFMYDHIFYGRIDEGFDRLDWLILHIGFSRFEKNISEFFFCDMTELREIVEHLRRYPIEPYVNLLTIKYGSSMIFNSKSYNIFTYIYSKHYNLIDDNQLYWLLGSFLLFDDIKD